VLGLDGAQGDIRASSGQDRWLGVERLPELEVGLWTRGACRRSRILSRARGPAQPPEAPPLEDGPCSSKRTPRTHAMQRKSDDFSGEEEWRTSMKRALSSAFFQFSPSIYFIYAKDHACFYSAIGLWPVSGRICLGSLL
jgi:hypothetical protein